MLKYVHSTLAVLHRVKERKLVLGSKWGLNAGYSTISRMKESVYSQKSDSRCWEILHSKGAALMQLFQGLEADEQHFPHQSFVYCLLNSVWDTFRCWHPPSRSGLFCFSHIPWMRLVLSLKSLSHKVNDECDQTRHPYDLPDVILLHTPHFNTDARTSLAFSFAVTWRDVWHTVSLQSLRQ